MVVIVLRETIGYRLLYSADLVTQFSLLSCITQQQRQYLLTDNFGEKLRAIEKRHDKITINVVRYDIITYRM